VVGPAVKTIASAVRVDAESKLGGNYYAVAESRKRFAHQFFVRERTINLGSVKKRNAALQCCTNDPDSVLSIHRRPVIGAQPHTAESQS
jgi:hypothetical protein